MPGVHIATAETDENSRPRAEAVDYSMLVAGAKVKSSTKADGCSGSDDSARAIIEGLPISDASHAISGRPTLSEQPRLSIKPCPPRLQMSMPPVNYGAVEPAIIFRSAYPLQENYHFMKSRRIKTVVTLVDGMTEEYSDFLGQNHLQHFQISVPANKDGVIKVTHAKMQEVLAIILNRANHPVWIHCNRGKHRTGCVVACFRKVLSHSTAYAIAEYKEYASPKARPDDVCFIESFDPLPMRALARQHGWLSTPPPELEDDFLHLRQDSGNLTLEEIADVKLPDSDTSS